jgi:hypothetical protein
LFYVTGNRYAQLETRWLDARGTARVVERELQERALAFAGAYRVAVPKSSTPTIGKRVIKTCAVKSPTVAALCSMPRSRADVGSAWAAMELPGASERLLASLLTREQYDTFGDGLDDFNAVVRKRRSRLKEPRARRVVRDVLLARSALGELIVSENLTDLSTIDTGDAIPSFRSSTSPTSTGPTSTDSTPTGP